MWNRMPAQWSPSGGAPLPSGRIDPAHSALDLLLSMGRELERKDPRKAEDCLRRACELAADLGADDAQIEALLTLGGLEIQRGALAGAEPLIERALSLAVPGDRKEAGTGPRAASCHNALARLRLRQGLGEEALALLRESMAALTGLASGPADSVRAETLELLGAAWTQRADAAQALRYYEEALELRRATGDELRAAQDLNQLGNLRHRTGQYPEAVSCYRQAYEALLAIGDPRAAAATANNLASTLMRLGELDEARRLFQDCLPRFQDMGEDDRVADVLSNLGLLDQIGGNMDRAEAHYLESLRLRREREDPIGESNSLTNLSYLAAVRGRLDEALARAEESIGLLRRTGAQSTLAPALVCRGIALLELNRLQEAASAAEEALVVARQARARDQHAEILAFRAQVQAALGSLDPALEDARQSLRMAEQTEDPEMLAFALRVLGGICLARGELDEAKDALARAARLLRGWDLSFERARILFEEGRLLARAGAPEAATERLLRVERIFGRLGNTRWRIQSLLGLAAIVQPGDPPQAEGYRAEARALADENGLAEWFETAVMSQPAAPAASAAGPAGDAARDRAAALDALVSSLLHTIASGDCDPGPCLDAFFGCLAGGLGPAHCRLIPDRGRAARWIAGACAEDRGNYRLLRRPDEDERERVVIVSAGSFPGSPAGPFASVELPVGPPEAPLGSLLLLREEQRPFGPLEVHLCSAAANVLALALEIQAERAERAGIPEVVSEGARFDGLVGASRPMRELYRLIAQSAPTDSSILILGESGVGKELVARSLHLRSRRGDGPFVAINCPSIPRDLFESELFGHERGAFTGAVTARPGKIELAQGGTLFLDEVGDMPLATQAKFLRFLQEREFERVGGRRPVRVDVRLVAATSRDLPAGIEKGEFRRDLYYRLNVVPLHVPALRDRMEDVPLLAQHFLSQLGSGQDVPRRVSAAVLDRLMAHEWPGNVRELRNTVEHMLALCEGDLLEVRHLPALLREAAPAREPGGEGGPASVPATEWAHLAIRPGETLESRLMKVEAALLRAALADSSWNQSLAARRLGITENKVRSRMKHYGIRRPPRERRRS